VLRRIFEPKRDEVTGGWRKLHSEELHNLYSSASVIRMIKSRRMRWAGHVTRLMHVGYWWESRKGKRLPGRPRHRWVILKLILEMGWGGMDWIDLAQDKDYGRALVNMVMNFQAV
jgi:hypothetical protein